MHRKSFFHVIPTLAIGVLMLVASQAKAQDDKFDPKKLPPINAAQARLEQTFKGLDGPGFAIVAKRDASLVAAACDRNTIQMWSKDVLFGIRDGDSSANVLKGHQGTVTDLAWNGGPVLASSGADKKIVLWALNTGKIANTIDPGELVRELAMSPDGKLLASAGDNNNIRLWDVASGKAVRELKGHTDWVTCLAFTSDSKQLVSGGYDGKGILWDVASGKNIRYLAPPTPPKKKEDPLVVVIVSSVTISFDGKIIALGRVNGEIDLVSPANGKTTRTLKGHTSRVTALKFHPTGTVLASSSKDGSLRLWNPANGGLFKELKDHKAWVQDVSFLSDWTRLATVGADRTVRVWNLTNP